MKHWILIFTCLVTNLSIGQENKAILDSLIKELENSIADSSRVIILNNLAVQYRNSDLKMVKKYAGEALELSKSLDYKNGTIRSYFNLGNMHFIGGDYPNTLANYMKALEVLEEIDDKAGIASAQMGIGNVLNAEGDQTKAIQYYELALDSYSELGDSLGMAGIYNNLGIIYMEMDELKKALEHHKKSAEIKLAMNYRKGMSSSYGNIGTVYSKLGQYETALGYQKKALEIREELNNLKGQAMSYNDIGEILYQLGRYNEALEYQLKSLEKAQSTEYRNGIRGALLSISQTYDKLNDYNNAYIYHKLYSDYKDSLFSIEKASEIADLVSVHEAEKHAQENELLKKDQEILKLESERQNNKIRKNEAELERRNTIISSGILVVALILVVVIVLYRQNRFKTTMNSKLRASNDEIAAKNSIIEEKNLALTDSIEYAKTIQDGILPSRESLFKGIGEGALYFRPKDIVSGDFYWRETISTENRVLLAVADCTGHGVPGAIVSVICHNALNRAVNIFKLSRPGEILDKTKELVVKEFSKSKGDVRDGMDIALVSITQNNDEYEIQFSGANNSLWILRSGSEEIEELDATSQPIGMFETEQPFSNHSTTLHSGDRIILFSDGFADQFGGERGKKFKLVNLKNLLTSNSNTPVKSLEEVLDRAYEDWRKDQEQLDDVCVMILELA